MRSLLSAAAYTSPEVLSREQHHIFRNHWIVAGFRSLLAGPDAFLTHNIGGIPIVIQNTANGARAFINRCAHRQSPIQLSEFGQRRMACPYHGWVYDGGGRVRSVPGNTAIYGFSDGVIAGLGLRPVALEVVGELMFVNLSARPAPLREQFDEAFLREVDGISSLVGDEAIFGSFDARYNWKLNFENVVDWNHVPFVHAGSFASLMPSLRARHSSPQDAAPAPDSEESIIDDVTTLSYVSRAPFDFHHWPWYDAVERCGPTREYVNVFIYPNVNYVVMAGAIHLIQQFCPIAPDRTRVRLTMALGRKKTRLAAAAAILWSQMKAEKRVIDEDIAVLEGIQRGLGDDSPPACHGHYEYRLRRIAKHYLSVMEMA